MTDIPQPTAMPPIVSAEEWQEAHARMMKQEKALTRLRDAISANRKRMPMTEIDATYTFTGADGNATLLDLFQGKHQMVLQHFMFHPDWDEGCDGCSMMADHVGPLSHLRARDTTYVAIARAPYEKLAGFRERMGWEMPFFSSFESTFNQDLGYTVDDEEHHGLSFLIHDGDKVYRTHAIDARGVELFISTFHFLDHTIFGRQETWEDAPEGWPQTEPYSWWRHHDRYEEPESGSCCH